MPRVKVRQEKNEAIEEKIQHTLEKRDREGTSFQDLAIEFGVLCSTLNEGQEEENHVGKCMKRSRPYL